MSESAVFAPNWSCPPGRSINTQLRRRNLTVTDLAAHLALPPSEVAQLLDGVLRITPALAAQLPIVVGGSAAFWLSRQEQYLDDLRRQATTERAWIESLPLADLKRFGWLRPITQAKDVASACLEFFDVGTVEEYEERWLDKLPQAAFHSSKSFAPESAATAAWLRQGEIEANKIACRAWSADRFAAALDQIRLLTREKSPAAFLPALQRMCQECGVAVVIVRAPKGCRASGATRFLSPIKATVQLSFRYLSDDQFWFTFFHEAGHLLLHSGDSFVEYDEQPLSPREQEANQFASTTLIPEPAQVSLSTLGRDARKVVRFARDLGIAPGIVVGQLQYRGFLPMNRLNWLKRRYAWGR